MFSMPCAIHTPIPCKLLEIRITYLYSYVLMAEKVGNGGRLDRSHARKVQHVLQHIQHAWEQTQGVPIRALLRDCLCSRWKSLFRTCGRRHRTGMDCNSEKT